MNSSKLASKSSARKQLINPRGYLSWTQVDMWCRSPERYVRQYMLGGANTLNNSGLAYGKRTSEALESGDTDGDELMDGVVSLLPRYKEREYEIKETLQTQHGDVVLLGKLDTFHWPKPIKFREYKTGRTKWTETKAVNHKQLHHYQTLCYLKYRSLAEIHLDWAETEEVDGEVRFTGHIQSFEVEITLQDVLEYMALVSRVAKEIDERYRKELKNLT